MNKPLAKPDWWRWPTFGLWLVFFLTGLFPERVFEELRWLGAVTTQDAYINSYHLITLALAGYLSWFVYRRGLEAGQDAQTASGKALQIAVIALVAFLPMRLDHAAQYLEIPVARLRHLIGAVAAGKFLCWGYLLAMLARYYFLSGDRVFQQMPLLFPSARAHQAERTEQPPPNEDATPGAFSSLEPEPPERKEGHGPG